VTGTRIPLKKGAGRICCQAARQWYVPTEPGSASCRLHSRAMPEGMPVHGEDTTASLYLVLVSGPRRALSKAQAGW